jgi:hypothetical protein
MSSIAHLQPVPPYDWAANVQVDNFIAEITSSPQYIAAAAESSAWAGHINNIKHGLDEIERRAPNDPAMAAAIDKISAIISDDDQHMGQRLHDLGALAIRLHEIEGTKH